ncbi:hypothetical protein HID58_015682 [Brassica napus]|uniref:Uncharacterized protein n=1 Tax=Brassica napus TaxID=3708 RepID=A0ABQ8DKS6_BRANA|nr:hypothetical protein HID58_015682 [Brassica napus]
MYLWEQEVPLDFCISFMSHTKNSMLQCMRRDWDPEKINIGEMRRDWANKILNPMQHLIHLQTRRWR